MCEPIDSLVIQHKMMMLDEHDEIELHLDDHLWLKKPITGVLLIESIMVSLEETMHTECIPNLLLLI